MVKLPDRMKRDLEQHENAVGYAAVGASIGAGVGAMVGGPVGAGVGGAIGGAFGGYYGARRDEEAKDQNATHID